MPPENASPTLDAARALLPLPTHNDLSEQQIRGAECVWCEEPLTTETAVDLGERRVRNLDTYFDTFPRGCRKCTAGHALRALHDHAPLCERCVDDASGCEIGVGLRRLMRGGWR